MPSALYLGNNNHGNEFQKVAVVRVERCVPVCVFQMNQVVIKSRNKIQQADGEQFPKTLGGLRLLCDHASFALTLPTGLILSSRLGNKSRFLMQFLDPNQNERPCVVPYWTNVPTL